MRLLPADTLKTSPLDAIGVSIAPYDLLLQNLTMTISATGVRFDEHTMWVELTEGRTLGVPLAWFPRLLRATPAERAQVESAALACTGKRSTRTFLSPACWQGEAT